MKKELEAVIIVALGCLTFLVWTILKATYPVIEIKADGGCLSWSYNVRLAGKLATAEAAELHNANLAQVIQTDRDRHSHDEKGAGE